jgi:hypothetical protein
MASCRVGSGRTPGLLVFGINIIFLLSRACGVFTQ